MGYILIALSAGQLFITCCYGHYVENKAERLTIAMTNNWLGYPPADRRTFIVMMAMAQHRQRLRTGKGFFEIGFEMFLMVREDRS